MADMKRFKKLSKIMFLLGPVGKQMIFYFVFNLLSHCVNGLPFLLLVQLVSLGLFDMQPRHAYDKGKNI